MKHKIGSFAETWMDQASVTQSEDSQTEEKQIPYMNAYVCKPKKWVPTDLYLQSRNRDTEVERKRMRGWDELGDGDGRVYTVETV